MIPLLVRACLRFVLCCAAPATSKAVVFKNDDQHPNHPKFRKISKIIKN
jgi:hypothetical protein